MPTGSGDRVEALTILSEEEANTIDAIAGRIIPGDAADPGAREAGAKIYIDRALGGFLRELRPFYRRAILGLDALTQERHGAAFADLETEAQDAVLADLERGGQGGTGDTEVRDVGWDEGSLLSTFFEVVREHILQGTFGDPAYGGNRDLVGWRLLGFPGARWGYTLEEMAPGVDAMSLPVKSLADLRRERPWDDSE